MKLSCLEVSAPDARSGQEEAEMLKAGMLAVVTIIMVTGCASTKSDENTERVGVAPGAAIALPADVQGTRGVLEGRTRS
jgi:hypothetical protein